jgi:hypothetical protein
MARLWLLAVGLTLAACAKSEDIGPGGNAGAGGNAGTGAGASAGAGGAAGADAGAGAGGGAGAGASGGGSGGASGGAGGTAGASGGAGGTAGASGGATGMDPGLSLPDPNGTPCTSYGYGTDCPGIEVCRISGPSSGRCEGCGPCGNLGASCTKSSDCDILFQCYQGKCTNICPLGTSYCGPVQDCLDVGNATYGVCKP